MRSDTKNPKKINKKNHLHKRSIVSAFLPFTSLQWMVVAICFLFHLQHGFAAVVVAAADNNDTLPKSPSETNIIISSTPTPTNNTDPASPPVPAEQLPVLQDNFDSSSDSLCLWQDDVGNLYNLSLLTKSEGYWEVSQRATEKQHFEIKLLFNFCSNFPKLDCTTTKQDSNALNGQESQTHEKNSILNQDSTKTAQDSQEDVEQKQVQQQYGAYQSVTVYGKQSQCDGFGRADRTVIELIDYYEVGRGLKVVYRGGEICQSSENPLDINSERTITFLVECPYNQPIGNTKKNQTTETKTATAAATQGSEQFKQLELDGISVTSCHPVLTIDHLAGCYMGQKKAQENKVQHPVLVFVLLLALTLAGLFIAIVTAFNCTTCQIHSFSAIPFYDAIKFYLEDRSKYSSSDGRTSAFSCLWGNKDSHKPI